VSPEIIQAIGRGELEPLIETPDEIVEPRNRRVEID
jgi:outer membrane protein OmpA-like peptidoglycan-associated protein